MSGNIIIPARNPIKIGTRMLNKNGLHFMTNTCILLFYFNAVVVTVLYFYLYALIVRLEVIFF